MIRKILEKLSLKKIKYMAAILAVVVVFTTTYSLILPAITVESDVAADAGIILENEENPIVDTSHAEAGTDMKDAADYSNGTDAGIEDADVATVTAGVEEDGDNPAAGDALQNSNETGTNMPAMQFEETVFSQKEDRLLHVKVEADADAFPDGVTMQVREVSDEAYVAEAIAQVAAEQYGEVKMFQAVDITFYDVDGNEIEPSKPIRVTMASDAIQEARMDEEQWQTIVHIPDQGDAEVISELPEWYLDSEPQENEVVFHADEFSVYAVVTLNPNTELDGKTYGILNNQNTISGTALMTGSASDGTQLTGKTLTVQTDPVGRTDNVFVAKNSNIAMWSFEKISGSNNQFYIKSVDNGKYLKLGSGSVSLVDAADSDCIITVDTGTGKYKGKYKFKNSKATLSLSGSNFKAESSTYNNANAWMNLAELSTLMDTDFVTYTATKVSVSDQENVKNGDQIIVYTRIWNADTSRYEYYIVDYDGMLVKAYESGDTISWVGTRVNTMLWDFTEYYYPGTTTPNNYYELQNAYTGKYLAPQISENGNYLYDHTIGINLNGRSNNQYHTTVLAWDAPYYDYASLMIKDGKLISAPINRASTFYFAVMKPNETSGELNQVSTMDHTDYGISLKIQDYGRGTTSGDYRSAEMNEVIGNTKFEPSKTSPDLLTKNITGTYPIATKTERSLYELFDEALEVNHQFIASTYQETGYFEYDSTQNFAHLIWQDSDPWIRQTSPDGHVYEKGDFVVYEQLGTTNEPNKLTLQHGQFLPFNDLDINQIASYTNEMDMHTTTQTAVPLSSLDPRKGEVLYLIPYKRNGEIPKYADHFFGMEMTASFMQSASGLDDWGHDLIFEFSGDDDFWLYIDNKLVLDLGGIHSALDGSINFRTGKVIVHGKETNLRTLYKEAYLQENPNAGEDAVNAWLNTIFKDDGTNTGTVFKDYSGHTMRMFYLERGAGASNLHMRFNLAPYTNGEVLLEKEVSGVENVDPSLQFPFQIYYRDSSWPQGRFDLLTDPMETTDPEGSEPQHLVKDSKTGEAIPYEATYPVADGLSYSSVFLLKPGQIASIQFPNEETEYYIRECGMDTETYDYVYANYEELAGENTVPSVDGRKDYTIAASKVADRKKVIYDNHVSPNAQKSLIVTKKLWEDYAKTRPISAERDPQEFRFRIYIGKEGENYSVYNTGKYYVKDPEGYYCIYDVQAHGFVSTGKTVFSELSSVVPEGEWKSEQDKATFYTSPGGAAERIKAGYSIEIPELLDGTAFLIVERNDEIPAGYNLIDYTRESVPEGETANAGMIRNATETIDINNQHGYGLIMNKIWSDAAFMETHDPIFYAVYLKGETGPLEGSVRVLWGDETNIRWFFTELHDGKTLNDYQVYEVVLDPDKYSVDPENKTFTMEKDCRITRVVEDGSIIVGGETSEHGYSANFVYTVNYDRETLSNEDTQPGSQVNSRTDTVRNSRPGIKIIKKDYAWKNHLQGAVFTLMKENDESSKKVFTSDGQGLIAVAYLTANEEYTLTEVTAPYKYLSLIDSVTIKVDTDNKVYVNGSVDVPENADYQIVQVENPTADNMPTITIRNKPFTLRAIKVDATDTSRTVEGVTFALYREVIEYYSNNPRPDYSPIEGMDSLTTGEDGVIPQVDLDHLSTGKTYYLRETAVPNAYKSLGFDIRIIITQTGQISIEKAVYSSQQGKWEFSQITDGSAVLLTDENGNLTLQIQDKPTEKVRILKKAVNADGESLSGAEFELYRMSQIGEDGKPKAGEIPMIPATATDQNGFLELGTLGGNTSYYLFETKAPDGYQLLSAPIIISTTTSGMVTATLDGTPLAKEKISGGTGNVDIWQFTVINNTGFILPSTGGSGTKWFYIIGGAVVLGTGLLMILRRRKRNDV